MLSIGRICAMSSPDTVLQIVPHLPGTMDGVGDYALNVARRLSADHALHTNFLVAGGTSATTKDGFDIISGLDLNRARGPTHVILHYANYGYQARGVPFALRSFVRQLRSQLRGRWITAFHELYASGAPWQSAFWLRPFQVRIAREMMDASTSCVVSNAPIADAIRAHDASKPLHLVPVMSNFGEPELASFRSASAKRWVVCGGTALIARSLRLFERLLLRIPLAFAPEHLDVIGGRSDVSIMSALDRLKMQMRVHHYPEVGVHLATELLREAAFGFIDYFGSGQMWPGMVLKSGVFAACCAHGIVPVLSHREEPIAIDGDALPGPYFLKEDAVALPAPGELPDVRRRYYEWYQAHAHSSKAAQVYAKALR